MEPGTLERERRRQAAEWIAWLRTMDWDFFATPSFRYPVSPRHALDAVTAWLAALPRSYAAIGLQRGPLGDRLHVHAMIGGTGRRPRVETLLQASWRRGNIHLVGYAPAKGAIEYLCRQADEIELLGTPVAYRRQR